MTERQRRVAGYILENYEEASFLTSTQLAEKSDTSEASVIRFANRLGFGRYADLQNELRTMVRGKLLQIDRLEQTPSPERFSGKLELAAHWMHTDMASIEKTLMALREDDLSAAVTAMCRAKRVFVVATHGEYGLACYFGHTLSWIRENVFVMEGSRDMNFDQMYGAGAEDLVVAMSFPPYPADTVKMLDIAIAGGADSIAITDGPSSPLACRATHCLYAHNEQLSFADNSAPTMSLLSVLLGLASRQDFQRSSQRLNQLSDFWIHSGVFHKEKE